MIYIHNNYIILLIASMSNILTFDFSSVFSIEVIKSIATKS